MTLHGSISLRGHTYPIPARLADGSSASLETTYPTPATLCEKTRVRFFRNPISFPHNALRSNREFLGENQSTLVNGPWIVLGEQ